jgi:hypothetical protein
LFGCSRFTDIVDKMLLSSDSINSIHQLKRDRKSRSNKAI